MCWLSNQDSPYLRRAKRDIKVYKYLKDRGDYAVSPIKRYFYFPNQTNPTINIQVYLNNNTSYLGRWIIEKGYHSFTRRAAKKTSFQFSLSTLHECIIPKGTLFYTNENGEIVSENLILKGKCVGKVNIKR